MLQRGIVKFFDAREGKNFGFIKVEGENDVFFHFERAACPTTVTVGRRTTVQAFEQKPPKRKPKSGDKLIFDLTEDRMGRLRAFWWTFAVDWDELAATIPSIEYRVTMVRKVHTSTSIVETSAVLWWGSDLTELSKLYPRAYSFGRNPDELRSHWDGSTKVDVIFEMDAGDGLGFEVIEDPRKYA